MAASRYLAPAERASRPEKALAARMTNGHLHAALWLPVATRETAARTATAPPSAPSTPSSGRTVAARVVVFVGELPRRRSAASTGHCYTNGEDERRPPTRLEISKYVPVGRKHVAYKEANIK